MCYHGYKINKFVYDELVRWKGGGVGLLENVSLYWDSKLKFESKQNIWGSEHSVDNISYFNIFVDYEYFNIRAGLREYTFHHSYLLTVMAIFVPKLSWNWYCTYKGVVQVLYNVQKEELSNSTRCPASTAGPIVTNLIAIVYCYGTVYNTGMEMLK